jgi:hypothetical protein
MPKYEPTTAENIDPFKTMDFLRDNAEDAGNYEKQVYVYKEMLKVVKAKLKLQAIDCKTEAAKETYAEAHPDYEAHILKTGDAIAQHKTLRLLTVAAEAKLEAWRSLEASARNEIRLSQ